MWEEGNTAMVGRRATGAPEADVYPVNLPIVGLLGTSLPRHPRAAGRSGAWPVGWCRTRVVGLRQLVPAGLRIQLGQLQEILRHGSLPLPFIAIRSHRSIASAASSCSPA